MQSLFALLLTCIVFLVAFIVFTRRRGTHQRANLQLLVEALPDPVLLIESDNRIVLVNGPTEQLLKIPPQQLIGKKFQDAIRDEALLELFADVAKNPVPNEPLHCEFRMMRDGQRLSFQALGERTENGGTLIVLRDVTALAGAIQMKTDFVANASHELRTPISAIKVAFETLRDVYTDDPVLTERCITIIDGHLHRLEEMLRDLLDLSRVENADQKPQFESVNAVEFLASIRQTWLPIAQDRDVRLELPESSTMSFMTDRRLLDLVLKNLVENAIKFTPAGGTVSISLDRKVGGKNEVELTVTDTGCGIPQEHIERVFERFYQVDSARSGAAGRGTGLGLAIVKHAVHALGGTVRLTSEVGKGTTATCNFPQ